MNIRSLRRARLLSLPVAVVSIFGLGLATTTALASTGGAAASPAAAAALARRGRK